MRGSSPIYPCNRRAARQCTLYHIIKARLKQPVIFDVRNLFEPADIKALGIEYHWIEWEG